MLFPGPVCQQLAAMALDADPRDVTDFLLSVFQLMHNPKGPGATQLTQEEEAALRRELGRN
jgi:hypothetical protein